MKVKTLLSGLLLVAVVLGPATIVLAAANDWHLNMRNSDDTADINHDIAQPVDGFVDTLVYDPAIGFPVWEQPSVFKTNVLDVLGYENTSQVNTAIAAATSTLNTKINTLQSQVNGINSFTPSAFFGTASTSSYIASSTPGLMSGLMVTKLNALSTSTPQHVERVRAQTDSSGTYTFTFATAFSATPVVSIDVESSTTGITQAYITSISTTAVTVQTSRATNVLGLLTLQSSPQLFVHIMAMEP